MKSFNKANTNGYNDDKLLELNNEWEQRVKDLKLEANTDEYDIEEKKFSNEVARR